MEQNNIVLVGMPGVGKSTSGVIVAKVLNLDFVDTDIVIQKATGSRLPALIKEHGQEGFMEMENQIVSKLDVSNSVIATGGSVIYGEDAMAHLKEIGVVIYLKADYTTISKRLGDLDARGVIHKSGQSLSDLYEERCLLYEKYADITINEDGYDFSSTINAITRNYYYYTHPEEHM